MSTIELKREPVTPAEPTDLLRTTALRAEALLGYSWLRKRMGIELGSLANTLNELGIEPFNKSAVKKYKAQKAAQAEDSAWAELRERAELEQFVRGLVPVGSHVRASWRRVPLEKYEGEVPAFALSRALEIKEKLPTAQFEVEELWVQKRYDPFLIARCEHERFYIDVWDEDFPNEFTAGCDRGQQEGIYGTTRQT